MLRPPTRWPTLLLLLTGACRAGSEGDGGAPDLVRPEEASLAKPEQAPADRSRAADAAGPCAPGLDLSPLQLEAHHCVVARFDLTGAPPAALGLRGDRLSTLLGGGSPYLLEVKEQTFSGPGQLAQPTTFFSASVTAGGKIYAADYLALTPSANAAAVGYTLDTTEGAIFWGERGGTPRRLDKAPGNYRALFLDETTLLVNGMGVGAAQDGQGLYLVREGQPARLLVKDLGQYSGHLALAAKALFVGGYFDKEGNKVFGFSLDEIRAAAQAGAQLSATADGDLVYAGDALDATSLEDDLVVLRADSSFKVVGVSRVPAKVNGSSVSVEPPVEVVGVPSGKLTVEKLAAWQGQLALLLTGGTSPQVALIRRRP